MTAAADAATAAVRVKVRRAFEPGGSLAGAIDGFVARDAQRELADAVLDAIVDRGTLLAEAGTGTGKTFGYLVPALLAGGKVLVSVGTRALQDQVFGKDLAALRQALEVRFDAALLKGRQNYVCRLRLEHATAEAALVSRDEAAQLRAIARFTALTDSGDRAELAAVPEAAPVWSSVTSTRDTCTGSECAHFDDCFVYRARRRAQCADVVVVNHHLFLADLALKDDAVHDFLPAVDCVILDEAHQLPRIASDFFGHGWSLRQVSDLARAARATGLRVAPDGARWMDLTQGLEAAARTVRLALADCGIAAGARIAVERISGAPALAATLEESALRMSALVKALQANSGRDPELDLIVPRASELRGAVIDWLECLTALPAQGTGAGNAPAGGGDRADRADRANGAGDGAAGADEVRWIAATAHGAQFHATPLVPGAAFARARERHTQAWILTSATLTVAGCFDPFIAEIGLAATVTRRWGSPFDFGRQARLYLPRPAPSPLLADFPERVADCAWPLLAAAGGRAFILCSTLRAVERVAARLRSLMARHALDLLLLEQGAGTRSALLDDFRHRRNAVLVGSVSFWEGIDVRGAALALVVIDKIPFAPPDDPVVGARIRRLRALGRNPFNEYQLPEAITMLRQGAGRLIRGEDDRGVLMIADERILTKPYGRVILDSLPPFARAVDAADACKFLQHVNADDLGKSRAG